MRNNTHNNEELLMKFKSSIDQESKFKVTVRLKQNSTLEYKAECLFVNELISLNDAFPDKISLKILERFDSNSHEIEVDFGSYALKINQMDNLYLEKEHALCISFCVITSNHTISCSYGITELDNEILWEDFSEASPFINVDKVLLNWFHLLTMCAFNEEVVSNYKGREQFFGYSFLPAKTGESSYNGSSLKKRV